MNLILSKADSYIFKLLKILLAACLATPFLASASFIFPYTVPKVFAFRILVEIAAVLYLYLALKYSRSLLPTLKKGGWGGFLSLSV
ncbi:hypothetical protein KJ784_01940, partial [Patescibacteria group bacterium]|nr:hypothetical protein [Patescibacteria group bacterium]